MKHGYIYPVTRLARVVPYIGTWIETNEHKNIPIYSSVVPYIGTWIETIIIDLLEISCMVVPYIGTWIETEGKVYDENWNGRTLYRYVD